MSLEIARRNVEYWRIREYEYVMRGKRANARHSTQLGHMRKCAENYLRTLELTKSKVHIVTIIGEKL